MIMAVGQNASDFIKSTNFAESLRKYNLSTISISQFRNRFVQDSWCDTGNDIRSQVIQVLEDRLAERFHGRFVPYGSSIDGTSVIRNNRFDYMYEVGIFETARLRVRGEGNDSLACRVSYDGNVRPGSTLFEEFCEHVEVVAKEMRGLKGTHGGFRSPEFSGVRVDGPVIALQFVWHDADPSRYLLSVNLSVGIRVGENMYYNLLGPKNDRNRAKLMEAICLDEPSFEVENCLHLVASPYEKNWSLTTSVFETNILQGVAKLSPLKLAIKITKILCHDLIDRIWDTTVNGKPIGDIFRDHVASAKMLEIIAPRGRRHSPELQNIMIKYMSVAHALMPKEGVQDMSCWEQPSREITIKTSAIHQIALRSACSVVGAFRSDQSDIIVQTLLRKIWEELASDLTSGVQHSIVSAPMDAYETSILTAGHKRQLARITRLQCQQVYEKMIGEDSCQNMDLADDIPDEYIDSHDCQKMAYLRTRFNQIASALEDELTQEDTSNETISDKTTTLLGNIRSLYEHFDTEVKSYDMHHASGDNSEEVAAAEVEPQTEDTDDELFEDPDFAQIAWIVLAVCVCLDVFPFKWAVLLILCTIYLELLITSALHLQFLS